MTQTPFTVDDLTVSEHGILSRKVKGNPGVLISDPSSQNAAEVLAGLCWLRDRRTDNRAKLDDYLDRTLHQLQVDLGLVDDDPGRPHRLMLAALDWIDGLAAAWATDNDELLEQLIEEGPSAGRHQHDPNLVQTSTHLGRALVYAVTGVDVEHGDETEDETPAQRAQEAIDTVTGENGEDPTVRPA